MKRRARMPTAAARTADSAVSASSSVGTWPPDHAGLEEPQLDPGRQAPEHLPPRERVDLELQALRRSLLRALQHTDVGGLVVHDHGAFVRLVDAVPPPAHPREPRPVRQAHPELALDEGRPAARRLLLVPEAPDGLAPGVATRRLVGRREEPLVPPLPLVRLEEVLERRVEAGRPPTEVVLDDAVERLPVHHRVVASDGDPQDVHVPVLQRARLVVVHLPVTQLEDDVRPERRLGPRSRPRRAPRTRADPRARPPSPAARPPAEGRAPRGRTG